MHDASFIPPNSTPFLPPNSTSRLRRSPEQAWRGRMAAANGGGFRSEHFRRLWSSWSLVVVPAALSYRRCPARRRARRPPKLRSPKLRSPKFKCLPRTRDGLSARSTATGSHSSVVNSHAKFRCSRWSHFVTSTYFVGTKLARGIFVELIAWIATYTHSVKSCIGADCALNCLSRRVETKQSSARSCW